MHFYLILFSLLIITFEYLNFSTSAIVRRESSSFKLQPNGTEPKQECKMKCRSTQFKRGRECFIECYGELPSTVRIAPILDQKCAEQCNGGPIGDYSNFKKECAIKCAIPE
ncbi:hypothetical protein Mgra_00002554 [Meloidogyne graminicola]|uniref:Uncharacterized protein n=1 Tax=Meloidogyne graminicola TaxID=189291 RepID=A0A8S9ZYW6_9BILA|nr:hypothetical protein Mgra_00002554 [Meloidogyne graminicola]